MAPFSYNNHRKFLSPITNNDTTVQTCLYFCHAKTQNATVSPNSPPIPTGFCPMPCLDICPSVCRYSLTLPDDSPGTPAHPNTPQQHNLSPLLITMLIVLATAFLVITFYIIYTKLCFYLYNPHNQTRRNRRTNRAHDSRVGNDYYVNEEHGPTMVFHPIWYISTVGLNPTVINSIGTHKYEKGDTLDDKDCTVCLGEFEEGQLLKVLPKCNHAFHVTCIDTWLRSHVTCPLCRAPVVPPPSDRDQTDKDSTTTTMMAVATGGGGAVEEGVVGRGDHQEGVESSLEGCVEDNKKEQVVDENNVIKDGSSSQRWSLERGAANLVSRSLSCSGKIFSSRSSNDDTPSPNS